VLNVNTIPYSVLISVLGSINLNVIHVLEIYIYTDHIDLHNYNFGLYLLIGDNGKVLDVKSRLIRC